MVARIDAALSGQGLSLACVLTDGNKERAATKDAASIAGLNVLGIVNDDEVSEPIPSEMTSDLMDEIEEFAQNGPVVFRSVQTSGRNNGTVLHEIELVDSRGKTIREKMFLHDLHNPTAYFAKACIFHGFWPVDSCVKSIRDSEAAVLDLLQETHADKLDQVRGQNAAAALWLQQLKVQELPPPLPVQNIFVHFHYDEHTSTHPCELALKRTNLEFFIQMAVLRSPQPCTSSSLQVASHFPQQLSISAALAFRQTLGQPSSQSLPMCDGTHARITWVRPISATAHLRSGHSWRKMDLLPHLLSSSTMVPEDLS